MRRALVIATALALWAAPAAARDTIKADQDYGSTWRVLNLSAPATSGEPLRLGDMPGSGLPCGVWFTGGSPLFRCGVAQAAGATTGGADFQGPGAYLTALTGGGTASGPGSAPLTLHLDAGIYVAGLLPLSNLTPGSAGQVLVTGAGPAASWGQVGSAGIASGAVGNTQAATMPALTAKANATNATAAPQDVAATADGQVFQRAAGALAFGLVQPASIAPSSTDGYTLTTVGGVPTWAPPSASGADALGAYLVGTATHAPVNAINLGTLSSGPVQISTSAGSVTSVSTLHGTAGNIPYFSSTGVLGQDSANFWDGTNHRLGIGTTSPQASLDVAGAINVGTHATGIAPQLLDLDLSSTQSFLVAYPSSGTNVVSTLEISPRGIANTSQSSQLFLHNKDLVADQTNIEYFGLRASEGGGYVISSGQGGTGAAHALMLASGWFTDRVTNANQILLNTDGTVLMSSLAGTGSALGKVDATGKWSRAVSGTDYAPAGSYITSLTGPVTATGPGAAASAINLAGGSISGQLALANQAAPTGSGLAGVTSGSWDAAATTVSTGLHRTSSVLTADLSVGVTGGQSVVGGTATTDSLTIKATSATPASGARIYLQTALGNDYFDPVVGTLALGTGATPLSLFKATTQTIVKTGGELAIQTNDANSVALGTNATPALVIDSAQGITFNSLASASTQCLEVNSGGKVIGTGGACATGTVTSVTATAPAASSGGTTPNITVGYDNVSITLNGVNQLQRAALAGAVTAPAGSNTTAIAANAVSFANIQTLGSHTLFGNFTGATANGQTASLPGASGVMEYVQGSPDTFTSFSAGAARIPSGSGTAGQFADDANFTFTNASGVRQLSIGASAATDANVNIEATGPTYGAIRATAPVGVAPGDTLTMTVDGPTGPRIESHTNPSGTSSGNYAAIRALWGANGYNVYGSPATAAGTARTWTEVLSVHPTNFSVTSLNGPFAAGNSAGNAQDIGPSGGVATSATTGFLRVSTMAGAPTATPGVPVNMVNTAYPVVYDRTNGRLDIGTAPGSAATWRTIGQDTSAMASGPLCNTTTTGLWSPCSSSALAAAQVWPPATEIYVSAGTSSAPTGSSDLTWTGNIVTVGDGANGGGELLVGGTASLSGLLRFWKDSTPTKAWSIGPATTSPFALTDDFHVQSFNGTAWTDRLIVSNSTGAVQIPQLAGASFVAADITGKLVANTQNVVTAASAPLQDVLGTVSFNTSDVDAPVYVTGGHIGVTEPGIQSFAWSESWSNSSTGLPQNAAYFIIPSGNLGLAQSNADTFVTTGSVGSTLNSQYGTINYPSIPFTQRATTGGQLSCSTWYAAGTGTGTDVVAFSLYYTTNPAGTSVTQVATGSVSNIATARGAIVNQSVSAIPTGAYVFLAIYRTDTASTRTITTINYNCQANLW